MLSTDMEDELGSTERHCMMANPQLLRNPNNRRSEDSLSWNNNKRKCIKLSCITETRVVFVLTSLTLSIVTFGTISLWPRMLAFHPDADKGATLTIVFAWFGIGRTISSTLFGRLSDHQSDNNIPFIIVNFLLAVIGSCYIHLTSEFHTGMVMLGSAMGCQTVLKSYINKSWGKGQRLAPFIRYGLYQSLFTLLLFSISLPMSWFNVLPMSSDVELEDWKRCIAGACFLFLILLIWYAGPSVVNRCFKKMQNQPAETEMVERPVVVVVAADEHKVEARELQVTHSRSSTCKKLALMLVFFFGVNIMIPLSTSTLTIIASPELVTAMNTSRVIIGFTNFNSSVFANSSYRLMFAIGCLSAIGQLLTVVTLATARSLLIRLPASMTVGGLIFTVIKLFTIVMLVGYYGEEDDTVADRLACCAFVALTPALQLFKLFRDAYWSEQLKPKTSGTQNGLITSFQSVCKAIFVPALLLVYDKHSYSSYWCAIVTVFAIATVALAVVLVIQDRTSENSRVALLLTKLMSLRTREPASRQWQTSVQPGTTKMVVTYSETI